MPALVSTLCICIVFVPMFLLGGVARYLFVPLAEAVVFAMLASYLLSRTLVPTLAMYWLQMHDPSDAASPRRTPLARFQRGSSAASTRLRDRYHALLERALRGIARLFLPSAFLGCWPSPFAACSRSWARTSSRPSMPARSGCMCAPTPARASRKPRALCDQVEDAIRRTIPASELGSILDNIGLPYSGINLSYSNSGADRPRRCRHPDLAQARTTARPPTTCASCAASCATSFPASTFCFLPADIVSQILNFGLPAPIDVQVVGSNIDANRAFADELLAQAAQGSRPRWTCASSRPFDYPKLNVDVDRTKARAAGLHAAATSPITC